MRVAVIAGIAALLGASSGAVVAQATNRPAVLSAPGARYVFGQINEYAASQFMLDTQTGRLWRLSQVCEDTSKASTCTKPMLVAVRYLDSPNGSDDLPPIESSKQQGRSR